VGLVSASMVGRRVINLLKPFGCDVMVYDPYLSAEDACLLDVRPVALAELFAEADIISVHAPITPETRRMITRAHFESIRDGALFVHTARAWVLDQDALLAELQKNRFNAYIDVFEPEPLPADHSFRDLDNVFLSPHVSGHAVENRMRLVEEIARDVQRYFDNQPLRLAVPYEKLSIMA
jgi:phosphoglycerate dehydrogenase-like enzyme